LNTNYSNSLPDHEDMLHNKKAAAYFSPWKHKIEQLSKGYSFSLPIRGRSCRDGKSFRKTPESGIPWRH
jgi:hypothetical protein